MAIQTRMIDDINGFPGAETHTFSLDDEYYEIDLALDMFNDLKKALELYIGRARSIPKPGRVNNAPVVDPADRDRIRAWAIANGRYCPPRGRFPNDLVTDFYADMKANPREYILSR